MLELVGRDAFPRTGAVMHIREAGSDSVLCGAPLVVKGRGEYGWHAAATRADYNRHLTEGVCRKCQRRAAGARYW